MRYSVVLNILVGIVGMMVVGCGNFGSGPSDKTRKEYSQFVESKMRRLLDTHARLVVQIQQRELNSERQTTINATLDDLTKQMEVIQRRIEVLKSAKRQDWLWLQSGMNEVLEEIAQSYDKALAGMRGKHAL